MRPSYQAVKRKGRKMSRSPPVVLPWAVPDGRLLDFKETGEESNLP